jgi:uncharacterized repeat protein (TIGR01451 family)
VAALKLTNTTSVNTVDAGGQLRYTTVVDNSTKSTARNVRACEALPATGIIHGRVGESDGCWFGSGRG